MQVLKFTLSGNTAIFKRPDVNSNVYFTYSHIHKVALLGILGSICGFGGYTQQKIHNNSCKTKNKKSAETVQPMDYPEFYEKLKNLKIAIKPSKPIYSKKIQKFNNSVGYASKEDGGNLIVTEQWIENPSWEIYILLDSDVANEIKNRILENNFVYIPYLGKNDHFANIQNAEVFNAEKVSSNNIKVNSMIENSKIQEFYDEEYDEDDDDDEIEDIFYRESLPTALEKVANQYILSKLVYTNKLLKLSDTENIFECQKENIYFL